MITAFAWKKRFSEDSSDAILRADGLSAVIDRLGFWLRMLRYLFAGGRHPRPQDGSCFYCGAIPVDRYGVCQSCRDRD